MKSLGGPGRSYLSPCDGQRHKEYKALWCCSREFAAPRSKQQVAFLGIHQRVTTVGLSLAVSSQHNHAVVHSVSAANSSDQANTETEEIETIYTEPLRTVLVRFKLTKECAFGQQFLVVGDDPILGLWDPAEGVPLNWSDGHVWTAELRVPSGKVIKYKFILKEDTETVTWQPGPDRILETWDTEKIIIVSEDWDDPQVQIIVEEELVVNEESLASSDLLVVAESMKETIVEEGVDVIEELENTSPIRPVEKLSAPMVAENIAVESGEQDDVVNDDHKKDEIILGNDGSKLLSSEDGDRLVLDEGVPVLVPGSILVPPDITEEEDEVEKHNVENQEVKLNEAEKHNVERQAAELNEVEKHNVESHVVKQLNTESEAIKINEEEKQNVEDEAEELSEEEKHNGEGTSTKSDEVGELAKPELKPGHGASASLHSTKPSETVDEKQQQTYNKEQPKENNDSILETDMQWGRRTLQQFLANFGFQ